MSLTLDELIEALQTAKESWHGSTTVLVDFRFEVKDVITDSSGVQILLEDK